MTFFESSQGVQLIDDHILLANLQDGDGNWRESEINLDHFIGNANGEFAWGGNDFSQSAKNIHLEGPILRADLMGNRGIREKQRIDLNDRISNEKGQLIFLP